MSGSVALLRHVTLETIEAEVFASVDGQGTPSYDSPMDVEARVLRQDKFTATGDGSMLKTQLTLWIPASEATQPGEQDRITYEDEQFIVAIVKEVKDSTAAVTHRRLRCRRE